MRIADYLVGKSVSYPTKSALKKAIKKKLIKVNECIAVTATFIKEGDRIELFPSGEKNNKRQLDFPLKVIYEDDYIAAINKPPGIPVSGNSFKTVDNALIQNLKPSSQIDACRPRPVHRLDYETTGVLLIGKTQSSVTKLNQLFEQKKITKRYIAVTIGEMENTNGKITLPLEGKECETHFKVIETVPSRRFKKLNLVELFPKTGRRHQLRIHLSQIGHEILGERKHGNPTLLLKGKGLFLHALSLKFKHPISHEAMLLKTEIPIRFEKVFKTDWKS